MKSKNVVEINGKIYDAQTGKSLEASKKTAMRASASSAAKKMTRPAMQSIDGFHKPVKKQAAARPMPVQVKAEASKSSAQRHVSKNVGHKAKRSTTLNRTVVKAPVLAVISPAAASEQADTVSSSALKHTDAKRLRRAQNITKSSVISRFNQTEAKQHQDKTADKPLTAVLAQSHSTDHKEAAKKHLTTKEALVKKAVASATTPTKKLSAKQHKSTRTKKRRVHVAGYASTAMAALLLAGYVAYLNVPSISMKVAAHRAGFAASLPSHKPAGFSMKGPIAYSPGQITINFSSNTDDRRFTLSQQPTTWDSTALLENLVAKESQNYVTYQDSGLTIYMYGDSDAAWVNGGKLYRVNGENAQLNTEQLLKLATSV